ncbi:MAG: hypothetical protein Q9159_004688 [Coniocarpon cinnabarinum]
MSLTDASPEDAAQAAARAALSLAALSGDARNNALLAIHEALHASRARILEANAADVKLAQQAARDGHLSQSLVKRLDLTRPGKYEDMLKGILDVCNLEDPIGRVQSRTQLDDGLLLERVSCPIGVLLIIFEARPEVIANITALAVKSGNAAILKGGRESTESFKAIASVVSRALQQTEVSSDAIQLVATRDAIEPLLQLDRFIDLVIPRGSNQLVSHIKGKTRIPVLGHADGLCILYLCADADADMATRVIVDSKCDYPAACNSLETLLVDEQGLLTIMPVVAEALLERGVSLRCDETAKKALSQTLDKHQALLLQPATSADFDTEFLDLTLAIKTIPQENDGQAALEHAISHINEHGSHHTDAILTSSQEKARRFQVGVDSAGVYWNASTRFADGMRYGFGTEVGISTNKIHSRGPVGLEGLTIYKYVLSGRGDTAQDFSTGRKSFKHERLPT